MSSLFSQAISSYSGWESRAKFNLSVLDRNGKLAEQVAIGEEGLYLYASPLEKQRDKAEIHLRPEEISVFISMCERLPWMN